MMKVPGGRLKPRWSEMSELAFKVMQNEMERMRIQHSRSGQRMNAGKEAASREGNEAWKQLSSDDRK